MKLCKPLFWPTVLRPAVVLATTFRIHTVLNVIPPPPTHAHLGGGAVVSVLVCTTICLPSPPPTAYVHVVQQVRVQHGGARVHLL